MFCSNGYLLDVCFGLCVEMRKKKWKSIGSMKSMIGNEWMGLCIWLNVRFFSLLTLCIGWCNAVPFRFATSCFFSSFLFWLNKHNYLFYLNGQWIAVSARHSVLVCCSGQWEYVSVYVGIGWLKPINNLLLLLFLECGEGSDEIDGMMCTAQYNIIA